MKILIIALTALLILSCSGRRTLSKHESGRDFNIAAENRGANVILVRGDTLVVENLHYGQGKFVYGKEHEDSLSFEEVNSILFYKIFPVQTAFKAALFTIALGFAVGITSDILLESEYGPPQYSYIYTGLGLVVSPISFIIGYLNGQNVVFVMKHRE